MNIGLIGHTARYALGHAFDVIVEGILDAGRYGEIWARWGDADQSHRRALARRGTTTSIARSITPRHETRPLASEVKTEQMRSWYQAHDLIPMIEQQIIDQRSTLVQTVERILTDLDWNPARFGNSGPMKVDTPSNSGPMKVDALGNLGPVKVEALGTVNWEMAGS